MDRANPIELRKAKEICESLLKIGLDFVPMPVVSDKDKATLTAELFKRLADLERDAGDE